MQGRLADCLAQSLAGLTLEAEAEPPKDGDVRADPPVERITVLLSVREPPEWK